jgi:hypothetical protein
VCQRGSQQDMDDVCAPALSFAGRPSRTNAKEGLHGMRRARSLNVVMIPVFRFVAACNITP